MKVQKIQSNQQTFGTKVKINPNFINRIAVAEEHQTLKKYVEILENNGVNDVLSLNQFYLPYVGKRGELRLFAQVYEIDGNKLTYGSVEEAKSFEKGPRGGYTIPNLLELYKKSKQNSFESGIHASKWVKYM